ncbi:AraC family transcriptional regulator [Bordetella genomosp. 5]|uniref:AraC family transcriptional regulator n=1 Tax=Bordetella genomosp. 5 TaxID=1395608 RepID=UPI000B9DDDAB|nr:AraC family transcriptional regulator [Bordetella genomosp. 5]OZI44833.1 AraC family transcriptional regulator [Bordetella genomosp. 5]
MDALSQLLTLGRFEARMDVRCLLDGPFVMPHDAMPTNELPFHLLLSGQCTVRTASGEIPMQAGDFVLISHGQAHTMAHSGAARVRSAGRALTRSTPGEHATLPLVSNLGTQARASVDLVCGRYVHPPGAGALLTQVLPPVLHATLAAATESPPLDALIALLRAESATARPGAHALINALGQALLALALRAHGRAAHAPPGMLRLLADARLAPSIQALLREPGADWTLDTLAERAAMSRATYARQVQAVAGTAAGALVSRLRMMQACELLQDPRRSVADVADAVGYRSEAAFGKAFQAVLGEPPGRWRRARAQG